MWRTPTGVRILEVAEAELIRNSLALAADLVANDPDPDDPWEFGVPVFDSLTTPQKIAMLLTVGSALLRAEVPCPPLTAIAEGTVAALFHNISQQIEIEIEAGDCLSRNERRVLKSWRELVLTACPVDEVDEPISEDCTDIDEWHLLIESLADGILWDGDFYLADEFLDLDPDANRAERELMGITDDYFVAIAPGSNRNRGPRHHVGLAGVVWRRLIEPC